MRTPDHIAILIYEFGDSNNLYIVFLPGLNGNKKLFSYCVRTTSVK